ncbi:MAG: methylated-DNA--[protein]-cysteine S-methyltransferase [Chlamydiales bacterium]|nr:methylated-DNA--[protein]-cysteine S-methyltransferase [Chlamydiales bacterium]
MSLLYTMQFSSPLGPFIAVADQNALYLLDFVEGRDVKGKVEKLKLITGADRIEQGWTEPLYSIEKELDSYFREGSVQFQTPVEMLGSPFQKKVWGELLTIPLGETRAYNEIARGIGKPTASRAVANANGANQLAILIPCHRVIQASGQLGGYAGGVARKKWLLEHERGCSV